MTELPTTFGKYYLTEKLATGGMAEIYLAKLIGPGGFEKPLVIKQILPKLTGQRHFVDLFVAEAKTLVTLAHGNIVPVYELGVVDDVYFIAMDYIDGPTLYRLTETMAGRDAKMEPAVAAWIAARILEGLDYAHRKGEGVIHRDLSPRNVMLSRDGEVKLVDFGIAVTLGEPGERGADEAVPTGSFPYMSPEQVRREPLDVKTDLFSLGVLCWEMLVGRRLFARGDAQATLDAVLSAEIPSPSSQRAEVPHKLDEVVMRALERDRDARWPSAAEMLAALNRYLYALDETPGPRDVAALVGRFCPPETRRLPTHVEAAGERGQTEPPPAGPRTAVIPRDAAARGKRPKRHQTFATNVDLEHLLERATPIHGVEALPEPEPEPEPEPARPITRRTQPRMEAVEEPIDPRGFAPGGSAAEGRRGSIETAEDRRGIIAPPLFGGAGGPSRAVLIVIGLGGLALAAAAVFVFFRGRAAVLRPDAAIERDAPAIVAPQPDAAPAPPIDASAPPADAPEPAADAAIHHAPRDAAIARVHVDASAAVPAATGTLAIGAVGVAYGDIYVDGQKLGNTPKQLVLPVGHHTVEVVDPNASPPRKQTFAIDVKVGEPAHVVADFR
ncbi:MAG TPA: serine/threonine-protein kinase [Kofleriaceae bacterium]|nr:serine/threonine-protein kinase [Kofleriaceae bacterium]